jgi:hypothetical protein
METLMDDLTYTLHLFDVLKDGFLRAAAGDWGPTSTLNRSVLLTHRPVHPVFRWTHRHSSRNRVMPFSRPNSFVSH